MTGRPQTCVLPQCADAVTVQNRAGQGTCKAHRLVVVTGSWVNDAHTEGGHG